MTATATLLTSPDSNSTLFFVMKPQDRADLLFLIDEAHVKAKTPLGERLLVLRERIDRRRPGC